MERVSDRSSKRRKMAVSAALGALIGFLAMMAIGRLFEADSIRLVGNSERIAALVGLLYALMALLVGTGLVLPRLGARFLNVEEAEDLREQRPMLAYAAAAMVAMGGTLIVLALAASGGVVPRTTALGGASALFAASLGLTALQWRHMDELMRRVTIEAGNVAFCLVLLAGGGWAMLAHLDFAPAPAPLDWLTMFFALVLVASFIATGRRGMLDPR